ncbi:protein turtle homolog A isoform X2 [Denticeps clupeoides]|uniref:protein turtle homolog A isoform X2 n=1 Tax=Denticeps clupeoides TaxID=299321 RepID=UPI0010A4B696|nr:protein turtle homolog A-like isoform X2 [Denticeps clupeoides]
MGPNRLLPLFACTAAALCYLCPSCEAEPSVSGKLGGAAVLPCSLAAPAAGAADSLHVVEWVRRGCDVPVLIKFGAYAPRVHPEYEGRVALTADGALRVEGLLLQDGGLYECRILPLEQSKEDAHNGSWTILSVTAPPVFSETPPLVQEVLLGKLLRLRCVATGNPQPAITWVKDGVVFAQNNVEVQSGTLTFASVTRATAGQYRCHASNTEGNVTHVMQLKVKGPPVIIIPPRDLVLNISQNAQLQCQAEADPPNMTYVWQKEGEVVYHIQSLKSRVKVLVDGTLLISQVIPEDSGNYTCIPTNGLLTPPTASAYLSVWHPALVIQMPKETYVPAGMKGLIPCALRAEPPLLRVEWSKDGKPLDLGMYPGWTLTSEGSVFMATANDDAAGVYTCTPYNSYGTMGTSQPTRVILQDPPSFKEAPRKEYWQEVGRTLVIPCQVNGNPAPTVTWKKVGRAPTSSYAVSTNGSLLLQPLSKDHQGAWVCSSTNRVATVNVSTAVLVLGTSPHAASSLTVSTGVNQANVSWEPGFDGGYTQKFTVWLKQLPSDGSGEKREWVSVSVPSSTTSLLVTGLLPGTEYQFSVLPHNKVGTGPFSEITTARTLDARPVVTHLEPPTLLSTKNQTSGGVVLKWSLPKGQYPPIDSLVLQSRLEEGVWSNLYENISASRSEMLVEGLRKDCVYEFRLLSLRAGELSVPGEAIGVSTAGLDVNPASSRLLEFVPEPLLAGLMGGLALLCIALLLTVGLACFLRQRRGQQCKKRRDDLLPGLFKRSPATAGPVAGSPDSVLKQKLLSPGSISTSSSSSSHSQPSCFESECHQQQRLPRRLSLPEHSFCDSQLTEGPLSPSSTLELISRGPDGRFVVHPAGSTLQTSIARTDLQKDAQASYVSRIQKSQSLRANRNNRNDPPFVLSVDLPPFRSSTLPGAKHLSIHVPHFLDQEYDFPNSFPDQSSLFSEDSESIMYTYPEQVQNSVCPTLKHTAHHSTGSTLVLQMEHEKERGNLSRCLTLAREREALEKELRKYTLNPSTVGTLERDPSNKQEVAKTRTEEERPVRKSQDPGNFQPRRGQRLTGNTCSVHEGSSANPGVPWEASPHISETSLVPVQMHPERTSEPSQRQDMSNHAPLFLRPDETPRLAASSSNSQPSSLRYQTLDRQQDSLFLKKCRMSCASGMDSLVHPHNPHSDQICHLVEMSVDEPDIREAMKPGFEREVHFGHHRDKGGKTSRSSRNLSAAESPRPALRKTLSLGSQTWHRHKNLFHQTKSEFLTPDAWIDSLTLNQSCVSSPNEFKSDETGEDPHREHSVETQHRSLLCLPTDACMHQTEPISHGRGLHHQTSIFKEGPDLHSKTPKQDSSLKESSQCLGWVPPNFVSPPAGHSKSTEEREELGRDAAPDVDAEISRFRNMEEAEGSYRSYSSQSSGRGSLDPPNSHRSLCLSPTITSSPETIDESDGEEDLECADKCQQRRASVDESYEWDPNYIPMHPLYLEQPVNKQSTEGVTRSRPKHVDHQKVAPDLISRGKRGMLPSVSLLHSGEKMSSCDLTTSNHVQQEPEMVLF